MDNSDTINILVVEPGKKPYAKEIGSDLDSLQKAVDAEIIQSVYPYREPVALICDDEGKMNGKELNRALRDDDGHIYDVVAGTFMIVGLGEEDFSSLSPELMKLFSEKFKTPEMFMNMGGRLMVIPVEEKERDKSSVLAKLNRPTAAKEPGKDIKPNKHKEETL